MENNRTDRQPRTVDFHYSTKSRLPSPHTIWTKPFKEGLPNRPDTALRRCRVSANCRWNRDARQRRHPSRERQGETRQNIFHHGIGRGRTERKVRGVKGLRRGLSRSDRGHGAEHENVARNARKIHRLCGWPENENHPRFSAVALRGYNTDERREILEGEIALLKPDLVILDGIKDLCRNIMDNPESTDVLDLLSRLSQDNNTAICCILHENKSSADSNMRGHLGTELINKCTEEYQVTKRTM